MDEIQRQYVEGLNKERLVELEKHAQTIQLFKEFALKKGIELNDDNFNYVRTMGLIVTYPNIVNHLNEEIVLDKDHLVSTKLISELYSSDYRQTGSSNSDNYFLFAHHYFRRGLDSQTNWAPHFIAKFWGFNEPLIESHVALDLNRVRIDMSSSQYMEFDTWYGASFSNQIENIKDGLVKLRPPLDIEPRVLDWLFKNNYSLDINWHTSGGIKTFQLAAFWDDTIRIEFEGQEVFPVKYVHAEYDISQGCFRHFDGAIHMYNEEDYLLRRESDFNYNFKGDVQIKSHSKKLFKLNGKIEVETWIDLTSHFLTGNPLVIEYFEGKYPDRLQGMIDKLRASNNK